MECELVESSPAELSLSSLLSSSLGLVSVLCRGSGNYNLSYYHHKFDITILLDFIGRKIANFARYKTFREDLVVNETGKS